MTRIFVASVLLLSIVVALASASDDIPECPCNSEMRDVSKEPCEPTCNDLESMRCDRSHLEKNTCPSRIRECRCMPGLVRNEYTNECVWPSDCPHPTVMIVTTTEEVTTTEYIPQCPNHEEHAICGRACEATCENPHIPECDLEKCVEHSCRCQDGYVRNTETDECVPLEMCPKPECPKYGEVMAPCGRACEGTCDNTFQPKMCSRNVCSTKECRCDLDAGLVRNKITDECVPMNLCPKKPATGRRHGRRQ